MMKKLVLIFILGIGSLMITSNAYADSSIRVLGMVYTDNNPSCHDSDYDGDRHRYFFGSGCGTTLSECRGVGLATGGNNYTAYLMIGANQSGYTLPTDCNDQRRPNFSFGTVQNPIVVPDNTNITVRVDTTPTGYKMTNWARYVLDVNGANCTGVNNGYVDGGIVSVDRNNSFNVSTGAIGPVVQIATTAGGTTTCDGNHFFFYNSDKPSSTPAPGFPTTIYKNESSNLSFTASTTNSNLTAGQIWIKRTDNNGSLIELISRNLSGLSQTFGNNWTPTDTGTYYVFTKLFTDTGPRCTADPWAKIIPGDPHTCQAGSSCAGSTATTLYSQCQSAATITVVPPPPTISLKVNQSGAASLPSGTYGISGKKNVWLNPLDIKLNASVASGSITDYRVAFYNKTAGLKQNITDIENYLTPGNLNNGFIVKNTGSTYSVWTGSISSGGSGYAEVAIPDFRVYLNNNPSNPILYTITGLSAGNWKVTFEDAYGSKSMYTAGYAVSNNGSAPAFSADLAPSK